MFIYFDLGNVLLNFDNELGCRQMAAVAGVEPEQVRQALFEGDRLKAQFERGALSRTQYHAAFCRQTGSTCDQAAWERAGNAIFTVNTPVTPVVNSLAAAGYRLGVLSNICESHWRHVSARYELLRLFEVHALSFEVGAMKPDPKIFVRAAELAGVKPEEVFYCDDVPGHVAAAREAGFDAVLFTSAREYAAEARRRGVVFNY